MNEGKWRVELPAKSEEALDWDDSRNKFLVWVICYLADNEALLRTDLITTTYFLKKDSSEIKEREGTEIWEYEELLKLCSFVRHSAKKCQFIILFFILTQNYTYNIIDE